MKSATRSMRAVVADEADQLLTGGYERDCRRVLKPRNLKSEVCNAQHARGGGG